MSNMIQVSIDSIRVSLMSPQRLVILRELNTDRFLPIWVGVYEAEAISVALKEIEMARPLTHDLLKNVINLFGARILRIEITSLRKNIFFGLIITEKNGEIIAIDSRPSDAIAIAVRTHVPIFVDVSVLDNASIYEEEDIQDENLPVEESPTLKDDNLSIFEEFLEELDDKDSAVGQDLDIPPNPEK